MQCLGMRGVCFCVVRVCGKHVVEGGMGITRKPPNLNPRCCSNTWDGWDIALNRVVDY